MPLNKIDNTSSCVTTETRREIAELLRGDFDLRPSLRTRIDSSLNEMIALTKDQYRILDDLQENDRVVVKGGAGTGKTVLAVEESCRWARQGKKVFLCCYNKNLAAYLQEAVREYDNITVRNIHAFMWEMIAASGLENRVPSLRTEDLMTVIFPEMCVEAMMTIGPFQSFDCLIVDEGQDVLLDAYYDVLDGVVKGGILNGNWKVFLDPFQDIFGGRSPAVVRVLTRSHPAQYRLSVNCRNTERIAVATAILSGTDANEIASIGGLEVEHHWYNDFEDQREGILELVQRLVQGKVSPSDIVILSPNKLERSCLSGGVVGNHRLTDVTDKRIKEDDIRFSTISAFKGLEADVVIVADIEDLTHGQSRTDIYVGCSRAKAFLAVFINQSQRSGYKELARAYGKKLTVR